MSHTITVTKVADETDDDVEYSLDGACDSSCEVYYRCLTCIDDATITDNMLSDWAADGVFERHDKSHIILDDGDPGVLSSECAVQSHPDLLLLNDWPEIEHVNCPSITPPAVPSTAWRMTDYYPDSYAKFMSALGIGIDYDDADFDRYRAEFMADLAAHDAQVRADALEAAADEYRSGQLTGIFMGRDDYPRQWLRARAATIRATAGSTKEEQ